MIICVIILLILAFIFHEHDVSLYNNHCVGYLMSIPHRKMCDYISNIILDQTKPLPFLHQKLITLNL
jgi:hypothetical protein